MMHWGPYSQWGVVESWSICSEDEPWCRRTIPDYVEYKTALRSPAQDLQPGEVRSGRVGGRGQGRRHALRRPYDQAPRRLLHVRHEADGLPHHRARTSPSPTTPRPNIVKEIFDAFRAEGFGIGRLLLQARLALARLLGARMGHARPQRQLRHEQVSRALEEIQGLHLQPDRGAHDRLRPRRHPLARRRLGPALRPMVRDRCRAFIKQPYNQDIDMPRIAAMARSHQPGLIVVDRTVDGPLRELPDARAGGPGEAPPLRLGDVHDHGRLLVVRPDDRYKSANRLIHLLVDIVSKGGNFLLNIGPEPRGRVRARSPRPAAARSATG